MRNKRERFVALAEARTERAINSIRLLENLGNPANYEFYSEDLSQIIRAVDAQVRQLRNTYTRALATEKNTFRLKSSTGASQIDSGDYE